MLSKLTSLIGLVARGPAAKGIAGGIGGILVTALDPAVQSFQKGFADGIGASTQELGLVLGQTIGAFLIGYVITWLAPANTPKAESK